MLLSFLCLRQGFPSSILDACFPIDPLAFKAFLACTHTFYFCYLPICPGESHFSSTRPRLLIFFSACFLQYRCRLLYPHYSPYCLQSLAFDLKLHQYTIALSQWIFFLHFNWFSNVMFKCMISGTKRYKSYFIILKLSAFQ